MQGARGKWGVLLVVGGQQPEPRGCVEPLRGGEAAAGAQAPLQPPLQPPYLSPASQGGGAAGWPGRGALHPAGTLPVPHTCKRGGVGAQGVARHPHPGVGVTSRGALPWLGVAIPKSLGEGVAGDLQLGDLRRGAGSGSPWEGAPIALWLVLTR